uniref:Uncharacterized protein n=1 Tax=Rhizophora mucronata TaxID=61149 RepID=A0A2P2K630_RHIMU
MAELMIWQASLHSGACCISAVYSSGRLHLFLGSLMKGLLLIHTEIHRTGSIDIHLLISSIFLVSPTITKD